MTRRTLSAMDKIRIILAQDGRCACGCGEKLRAPHIQFDHINQSALSGDESLENFRALTAEHHKPKTAADARARAKVRRLRAAKEGRPKRKGRKLAGRGFPKHLTRHLDGTVSRREK